jgi:hypothetical protein
VVTGTVMPWWKMYPTTMATGMMNRNNAIK